MSFKSYIKERDDSIRFIDDGIKVIDSKHAIHRYEERVPGSANQINNMLHKIVNYFKSGREKTGIEEYLFYSKGYDQAIVVAYRKERREFATDNKKHVVIITILPKGKKEAREGTPRIAFESHSDNLFNSDEFNILEWIEADNSIINESLCNCDFTIQNIFEGLDLIVVEGKAYNFSGSLEIVELK